MHCQKENIITLWSQPKTNPVRMLIISLVYLTAPLFAVQSYQPQETDPLLNPYGRQSLIHLAGIGVHCMAEDQNGHLWLGTGKQGVYEYDGIKLRAVGLDGLPVHTIAVAHNGSVFAGNDQGVYKLNNGHWDYVIPSESSFYWFVSEIYQSRDRSLWICTAWGALHIHHNRFQLFTTCEKMKALKPIFPWLHYYLIPEEITLKQGWIKGLGFDVISSGSSDSLVFIRSVAPGSSADEAGLKIGDRIRAVDGTAEFLEERLDGEYGSSIQLTIQRCAPDTLFDIQIQRKRVYGKYLSFWTTNIFQDKRGIFWLGLHGYLSDGAIVRYTPFRKGKQWTRYTNRDCPGIGGGIFSKRILQRQDGSIWLVSLRGLCRFNGKKWIQINPERLMSCQSILETKDRALWIGRIDGLSILREDQWTNYSTRENQIPRGQLKLFETVDGAVWMLGMGTEVVRLDYHSGRWTGFRNLFYQCETDSAYWFITNKGTVVCNRGHEWFEYTTEDGIMDTPQAMAADGENLWFVGNHNNNASIACFTDSNRTMQTHPFFCANAGRSGVFIASDKSIWFSARDADPGFGEDWGVLRFIPHNQAQKRDQWFRYEPPDAPIQTLAIGQTSDGRLWFGGEQLYWFDGEKWERQIKPENVNFETEDIFTTREGHLWVATRWDGLLKFNGKDWIQLDIKRGLPDNLVSHVIKNKRGHVWAATEKGIGCYDGVKWKAGLFSPPLIIHTKRYAPMAELKESRDGSIWINQDFGTYRYFSYNDPPETEMMANFNRVAQGGNTILSWEGADRWNLTPKKDIEYSFRMDGNPWSPFSQETSHAFFALSNGKHIFKVRARDGDYNVDADPTVIQFSVVPPVWQQLWFQILMGFLAGVILILLVYVIQRSNRLHESNIVLRERSRELELSNAELKNYVYVASHDLKEPLRSVASYVQLLALRYQDKLGKEADDYIQFAVTGVQRMNQVINDFLAYSKLHIQKKEMTNNNCNKIVSDIIDYMEKDIKKNKAQIHVQPLPIVRADSAELSQLFFHLINNAIKFRSRKNPVIEISAHKNTAEWIFSVQDNGIGIPKEFQNKVFELFQKLHTKDQYAGTGIGLALCRKIVEQHDGKIWVESSKGQGSSFHFSLPVNIITANENNDGIITKRK